MGRPPCCEKSGVEKGPWSPEEDLLLVSYVEKHGTGNWRDVPVNTGLKRCNKSCRLRWRNYLRPGIKRGNFSDQEERLIIGLQKLLGNRWSAIASYMTDQTDNDIKNYWNTHLKRKLARESGSAAANKGLWERHLQIDFHTASHAFQQALSINTAQPTIKPEPVPVPEPGISTAMYAFSMENIARLLEDWMRPNASGKAPAKSRSSVPVSGGGEGRSGSHNTKAHTLEVFVGTTKVEAAGSAGPGPSSSSFPLLESWLFDDDIGHDDAGLSGLTLADPGEFF